MRLCRDGPDGNCMRLLVRLDLPWVVERKIAQAWVRVVWVVCVVKDSSPLRGGNGWSSPVEWCNRFVSFGLGYALSWSGVSSCWVGCGVSRDLVRMSRLR